MKILVTGAGGLLGHSISAQLIKKGHQVTGLARGHYPELEALGVKMIVGDITNEEQMVDLLKDQEACFHVAGKVAMWGQWRDFYQVNVQGTKNIINACKKNKIKYLIYTSSPSVIFGKESIQGADESIPYPQKIYGLYARSKAMAEQIILRNNGAELKTVSLRPHLIFGPKDKNLVPKIIESAKKERLKIIGDGTNQVDVIFVENAAEAHLMALDKLLISAPVDGEVFFLGQGPVPLWGFINQILEKNELPPVTKRISYFKAFYIGWFIEIILRSLRIYHYQPPMTRFVALQMSKSHYYSHQKAKKLLGWVPRVGLEEALSKIN